MMVRTGIDRFLDTASRKQYISARVALLSHLNAVDRNLIPTIDRIANLPDLSLRALFAPEHGLAGVAQAGAHVDDEMHPRYNVPVYSLYGTRSKPDAQMLKDIDLLLVDFQDIGVRFYTYLSTLGYVLEAAAEKNIPVVVLDRSNPLTGLYPEGSVLQAECYSFVGRYPIPIRHGLTIGELANWIVMTANLSLSLEVVPVEGWSRKMWFDQTGRPWVPTSPNLPALDTAIVYPGMALFEGTNVSEGRGTTKPFEYFGAPWIDPSAVIHCFHSRKLPGVRLREVRFIPTFSKYQGELCKGAQVHVTDREKFRPILTAVHLLQVLADLYPNTFRWTKPVKGLYFIDLLSGTQELRNVIDQGQDVNLLYKKWEADAQQFHKTIASNFLYK